MKAHLRGRAYYIWLKTGESNNVKNYFQAIKEEFTENNHTCCICFERCYNPCILKCDHYYCFRCISEWRKRSKTCPLCREYISF